MIGAGCSAAQDDRLADRRADRRMRRGLAVFVASVSCVLGARACVVEPVRVRSDSMSPALRDGDWVLIDKLSDRWRPLRVDDVVTAIEPDTGRLVIKRIVAVGGQSVGLDDGRLVVDGELVDEPHVDASRMAGRYFGPVTVPRGHVFLLGDDRDDSRDSRAFGPVPSDHVTGRVVAVL